MPEQESPQQGRRRAPGRGLAVILLVLGLLIGIGIGYLFAPRPAPQQPENVLVLSGTRVFVAVLAGPPGDSLSFSIGGLKNPTVQVKAGTNVTVYFRNIDPTIPHSWGLLSQGPPYGAQPPEEVAFPGAESPDAHMGTMPGENATLAFTASTVGTYWYLCHVPGHAAGGMYGKFEVRP